RIKSHQAGRGDNTGLAHASAEHLPSLACPGDEVSCAAQDRPYGSAQSLGEAETHGINRFGESRGGDPEGGRRVEDARAIKVNTTAIRVREFARRCRVPGSEDCATTSIMGILQTEQPGWRVVKVVR